MIEKLLDQAEHTWRDIIRLEYPLFADMPVVKVNPDPKNDRHWQFYTDNKSVHMELFKPDAVEKTFLKKIIGIYEDAYGIEITDRKELEQILHHDNFTYLYFHELFHPIFCPDSKEDEKLVDKAIYKGIRKAGFSNVEALAKAGNVRNAVWDYVIDTAFFYFSNFNNTVEKRLKKVLEKRKDFEGNEIRQKIKKMPDGVVTIFDTIEYAMMKEPPKSLFYPLSRSIYGLTMCKTAGTRKKVFDELSSVLKKPMAGEERTAITSAFKGLISELSDEQVKFLYIEREDFERDIDLIYDHYDNEDVDILHNQTISNIAQILLDKKTRYDAIRGFIRPLAKYISLVEEEKRHGTHILNVKPNDGDKKPGQTPINQPGGNTQQAMLNLAAILGQSEASGLLQAVANAQGLKGGTALADPKLQNLARDEYYKKNVEESLIKSPKMEAKSIELGKIQKHVLVSSTNLSPSDLVNYDLEKILEFQQMTGITQLFQISDFEFRYDRYELQEFDEVDYRFEPTGIELPANVIFHVDSSGSMGGADYVGTGSSYDTLMHVCYSILKTMKKAAVENKKQVNVLAANFSNGTIISPKSYELQEMYNTPNNEVKTTLMGFQGGGTEYSPDAFNKLKKLQKPGKTVHLWISDGELSGNSAPGTLNKINEISRDQDTAFVYFEIGSESSFGKSLKALNRNNVKVYTGVTIDQIQKKSLEVMIKYD